ncbi:MAG: hypothetical protein WC980_08135 [Candidatus Brocadiia bacterium]
MLDFIKSVSRRLARRVIFARAFQWGAYGAVLAVLSALASKLIIPDSHLLFFISYFCVTLGLVIGVVIGIINRPSLMDTAIFLDEKLADRNYLSTFVECVNKASLNPVETKLLDNSGFQISALTIAYKYSNLIMFLIAAIVLVIIQQTPLPSLEIQNPKSEIRNNAQISNIKTEVKTLQATAGNTSNDLLAKIEQLVREMEQGSATPSAILEKINEFSPSARDLPRDSPDAARIRALLDKLQEYYKIAENKQDTGFSRAPSSAGRANAQAGSGDTSGQTTGDNQLNQLNPLTKEPEVTPAYLKKIYEEAITRPSWPAEYDEVIEKYFK